MSDTPDEVVEAMARSIDHLFWNTAMARDAARLALAALPPAMLAVGRSEAVAVPREATTEMKMAGSVVISIPRGSLRLSWDDCSRAWDAMLVASPFAPKEGKP